MAKAKFSYDQSFSELQEIIDAISNGEIGIDQLQEKVKKARALLTACNKKLRATEAEIEKMIE